MHLMKQSAKSNHTVADATATTTSEQHNKRSGVDDTVVRFDMKYYGRIWEFSNQYWWQMRGLVKSKVNGTSHYDCTHYRKDVHTDGPCMHKFFIQAMIDDHFQEYSRV